MSSRFAIVDGDKCKPSKCKRECEKYCPVNQQGKQCISHSGKDIAKISEEFCTKKRPFNAITIVNLPKTLGNVTHRHPLNGFQLYN